MRLIRREDGVVVEDEGEILHNIESYYIKIFAKDNQLQAHHVDERRHVLALLMNKLSNRDVAVLDRLPNLAKVEVVVMSLKARKSPGLDGLTPKVLKCSWGWIKEELWEVVKAFWADGVLTTIDARGVIRLIPKLGELELLKNWRPITMLSLIYKILSKILATHLKPFMQFLVDLEESGFIKGRKILDNILAFKIGKDYAKFKKLLAFLLKLDFIKAYNKLDHSYLKDKMRGMGFNELFITLVMGLVYNGSSKVHINGLFTKEIVLGRGVR